ncbi:MAG: methylase [Verrucomicrobiales bacterium]|nr:methylase [Verrucomicrobiales bacterium]
MGSTEIARQLRRDQTNEEKQMWRALRAGRFAGFKFRRQHPIANYIVDFYCPQARVVVELDGFQHGLPDNICKDAERDRTLADQGIHVLRYWNRHWRSNRDGILLEIWNALQSRRGCVQIMRQDENNRYVPPELKQLKQKSAG